MSRLLLPVAGGFAGLAAAFLVMQLITTGAFEQLEARQVAQDADRIRIGLNSQAQLLTAFGATNAVWDNAYNDIGNSDKDGFAADFPPEAQNSANDIDGMFGIGADGTLRVGGMTTDAPTHGTPPRNCRTRRCCGSCSTPPPNPACRAAASCRRTRPTCSAASAPSRAAARAPRPAG
ncbi:CHASE4 domain-containing protein [Dactylosporangium cerinum]